MFSFFSSSAPDYYLGSDYRGNYVWSGAMNLAWHGLNNDLLHDKLILATSDPVALDMVRKLNSAAFTTRDLDEPSYYVKSGFGQKTVTAINRETRLKFPGKTFEDLEIRIGDRDIISYAYYLKQVEYAVVFSKKPVRFRDRQVSGFSAKEYEQQQNVRIAKYWHDDRFIISLKLKDESDELFLLKGFEGEKPGAVTAAVNDYADAEMPAMGYNDLFEMPDLHLDMRREYPELLGNEKTGPFLANRGFTEYFIGAMYENIRFDMDYKGARVEAEAVMAVRAGCAPGKEKIKKLILDKPFWVVMKRRGSSNPYFILGVNTPHLMQIVE